MDRLNALVILVAFAIFATLLMFFSALIIHVLGPVAIYFVWIVCVPIECLLIFGGLVVMFVIQANALRFLKLKRGDMEHHFHTLRVKRELEVQKQRLQLHLYRRRIYRGVSSPRRVKMQTRPPVDHSENGC